MSVPNSSRKQLRTKLVLLPSPALAQADDGSLVTAAASGDPRAAAVLWDRFSPQVRTMMRRVLGVHDQVEDLLQEVFLGVVRQGAGLRDVRALGPLVAATTVRVLRSELRRRRLRRLFLLTPTHNAPAAEADALARLYASLDRLDPDSRLLFTLRHFEGMLTSEIAAALEVSVARAKRRLASARRRVLALSSRASRTDGSATKLQALESGP